MKMIIICDLYPLVVFSFVYLFVLRFVYLFCLCWVIVVCRFSLLLTKGNYSLLHAVHGLLIAMVSLAAEHWL